ncbi:hypothetical protein [Rosistilla oblonga]|nr:hypothetical protein [Rosistilla oblonga]
MSLQHTMRDALFAARSIGFVMSENLHRRHLEPTQRAACALRARDLYDQRAKERQVRKSQNSVQEDLPEKNQQARDEVGKVFGVSGGLVEHVKRITTTESRS